jgi:hypothetical protein
MHLPIASQWPKELGKLKRIAAYFQWFEEAPRMRHSVAGRLKNQYGKRCP